METCSQFNKSEEHSQTARGKLGHEASTGNLIGGDGR